MNGLERLARALAIEAFDDHEALADAAEQQQRELGLAQQELGDAQVRIAELEQQLAAAGEPIEHALAAQRTQITADHLIANAYRDGKLRYTRDDEGRAQPSRFERQLRTLAETDGIEALEDEIRGMPQIVPVGRNVLQEVGPDTIPIGGPYPNGPVIDPTQEFDIPSERHPALDRFGVPPPRRAPVADAGAHGGLDANERAVCDQLGLDPADYIATRESMRSGQ